MVRTLKGDVFSRGDQAFRDGMDAFEAHEVTEVILTPIGNVDSAFQVFCREAANYVRKNPDNCVGILIDEIRFMDLTNEDLDWILRCSSVENVHIVFTGHRPKDVPTDIRAIADRWCLFSFTLPRDVEIIEDQCSPKVAQAVQGLQARQFVTWDDRTASATFHRDPVVWFVETRQKGTARAEPIDTMPAGEKAVDKGSLFP
jgi:hypothetical protein